MGSSKQGSCFEATTNIIINHAQENFNSGEDVAEALRTMISLNAYECRTIMSASTSCDEALRDRERSDFELDYKGESAAYRKHVREYEKDLDKPRTLL